MSDTILMDIDIPEAGVKKAISNISQLTKEIEALKLKNKELGKTDPKFIKNAADVKALTQQMKVNERVVVANTKAQMANEGSVEQLRAQLSGVTVEWSKLSKEERENTDAGKALKKSKSDLTSQLKQVEEATGDNRRSVGNYSLGMRDAMETSGLLSKEQQMLAKAQKAYTVVTNGATGATKLFKIALISTGIGAIVVLIGSLVAAFLSTQEGIDMVNKVIKPLQFAFQRIIGVFQKVATALASLDFKKAWSELKLFGSEVKAGIKDGQDFANSQIALKDAQLALAKVQGELNRTFSEQKAIIQDVTKSEEERLKAGNKALAALQKRTDLEANILKEQIKQAELDTQQNDTKYEAQIALAELQGELAQLEADRLTKSLEIGNQINSVTKQQAATQKAANEAYKELAAERLQADLDAATERTRIEKEEADKRIEIAKAEMKAKMDDAVLTSNEELNAIKQLYVDGIFSRQQYDAYLHELQLKALETEKVLLEAAGQATIDIDTKILDFKIASIGKEVEITSLAETSKTDLVGKGAAAAGDILGKQSIAFKALSSVEAAMNTYTAATAALKIPVFGQLQAALITIQGLAQVAKINATPLPKFATGMIGVDGPGTGTSDSITANISKGESVMTARATSQFAPQLAAMESAVGNKPRLGYSGRKFAQGVIGMDSNAARISGNVAMSENNSLIRNLRNANITVSVVEIQDRIKDVDTAKSFAQVVE